jgi:predicted component of type VI protein secretion system
MLNVLAAAEVAVRVKPRQQIQSQRGVVPVVVEVQYLKDFIPHQICHHRNLLP